MKPSIQALQATRDRVLRDVIDRDPGVQQALEHLRHLRSGRGFEYRRNLLSRALRVTRSMSPELAEGVTQAREQLGLEAPVELYVVSQPEFNATCAREHNGLVIVTLTSRLVEEFSSAEIRFVIGHELGHALFGHFDIPMPATAVLHQYGVPFVSKAMALKLYAWCRVTEVTADRVGAVCAGDPKAAISGLFKLASGTSSPRLKPDLEAFANQVHSLSSTPEARDASHDQRTLDCFSTHPYNPIRVR
ncbi:MAG: M48 family metallopeptidase, partial [Myxococcota bacterium]